MASHARAWRRAERAKEARRQTPTPTGIGSCLPRAPLRGQQLPPPPHPRLIWGLRSQLSRWDFPLDLCRCLASTATTPSPILGPAQAQLRRRDPLRGAGPAGPLSSGQAQEGICQGHVSR